MTTDVDQTLTCKIGELDDSHPVTVAWKDPDDAAVSDSDTNNYGLSQGEVDGSGNQEAVLTIKPAKLLSFGSDSTFTYKCSVTSSQYSDSPASSEIDVVANVLKLGWLLSVTHITRTMNFHHCLMYLDLS